MSLPVPVSTTDKILLPAIQNLGRGVNDSPAAFVRREILTRILAVAAILFRAVDTVSNMGVAFGKSAGRVLRKAGIKAIGEDAVSKVAIRVYFEGAMDSVIHHPGLMFRLIWNPHIRAPRMNALPKCNKKTAQGKADPLIGQFHAVKVKPIKAELKSILDNVKEDLADLQAVQRNLDAILQTGVKEDHQLQNAIVDDDYKKLSANDLLAVYALSLHLRKGVKQKFQYVKANRQLNYIIVDLKERVLRKYASAGPAGQAEIIQIVESLEAKLKKIDQGLFKELKEDLQLLSGKSIFMDLESADPKKGLHSLSQARFPHKIDARPVHMPEKPSVLHASLEYRGAMVGGIAAVTQTLLPAQNKYGHDARMVTPFYDFYHREYENPEFCGFVTHEFEGAIVRSAVYKVRTPVKGSEKGVKHYLIKPDPETRPQFFNIGREKAIYFNFPHSGRLDRMFYFSSAVASLAASYRGKKKQKSFDVLHVHAWHLGLANMLLGTFYNPFRKKIGLPAIRTAMHLHHLSKDQGFCMPYYYRKIGLKTSPFSFVRNIQKDSQLSSDLMFHVSKAVAGQSITKSGGFGLHKISEEAYKQGRLMGITNGIAHSDFNPLNPALMKQFAIKQQLVEKNGTTVDETDYLKYKEACKELLAEKGIIADPKKPLFMFVGRYCPEKGIDMLPALADEVKKNGGQSVVMGVRYKEPKLEPILAQLKKISEDPKNFMKFYSELSKQTDQLEGTGVSIGTLIRFASDVVMVPSHFEACGLVPMESFAMGAPVVTTMTQGLKDMCVALADDTLGHPDSLLKSPFNSIGYEDDGNREANSREAIRKAFKLVQEEHTPRKVRNHIIGRLITSAPQYDWAAAGGSLETTEKAYKSVKQ